MRKTAIILVFIISIACLSSCGIQQQLAAPANLRLEDSTIKWNSVEGAMSYVIYADGNEIATTSNTYYNLSTLQFEDGRTYGITVRSRGDGYLKLASTDSISISYTHENTDTPPITDTDPVVDDSVAKDLFNSGLGYGVNALTAKRAISGTRLSSFFDETQITVDFLGSYDIGSSRSKAVFRENIADEIIAINSKLVYGASLEASLSGMFSAGFEEKFSLETAFESELSTHQLYFILNMYVIGKNYQLKNYQQPRAYSDKISEFALKDIQALRNGTLTPSVFFDRYGTHLTMAVSYGGMTEVNYSMQSKEKIDSAKIASSLESKLTASYSYDGVDAEGAASYGIELQNEFMVSTSDTVANLYIESIGKKPLTANTFVDFTTGYTEWAKQFEDDENFRVVDVADGGLVPIWNYFPE
ncbi:MAG: MAC/perforin domain-containing protein, partial [Candidatus Fimimonas sp.]